MACSKPSLRSARAPEWVEGGGAGGRLLACLSSDGKDLPVNSERLSFTAFISPPSSATPMAPGEASNKGGGNFCLADKRSAARPASVRQPGCAGQMNMCFVGCFTLAIFGVWTLSIYGFSRPDVLLLGRAPIPGLYRSIRPPKKLLTKEHPCSGAGTDAGAGERSVAQNLVVDVLVVRCTTVPGDEPRKRGSARRTPRAHESIVRGLHNPLARTLLSRYMCRVP